MLKDKVLHILEQKKGTIVTGGQLAISLNVSRTAIWKAIKALRESGNQIVSIPNVGYKLLATDDSLSKWGITKRLSTSFIGRELTILPAVKSTNQYLKELDTTSVSNGFVVIANEQSQGRGRRSRTFISTKDEGIYLSILLKINGQQHDLRLLTICTAVAVSKALATSCNINAEIKWVNDIFCNGRKICGILTEATLSAELQELDTVIIGIGINTGRIAKALKDIATSIQEETGMKGIRNNLIADVLNQFELIYLDYISGDKSQDIIKYYERKLFIKNKDVSIVDNGDEYPAKVLGVNSSGALIVQNRNGEVLHISTGEIKLK